MGLLRQGLIDDTDKRVKGAKAHVFFLHKHLNRVCVLLPDCAGAAGRVGRDPAPDDALYTAAAAQEEAKDHLPPLH